MALYESMPRRIDDVLKSRVIGPITKDFVSNLNKIEYMYVIYHLALQYTFLLSMYCEILQHVHNLVQYLIQFSNMKKSL